MGSIVTFYSYKGGVGRTMAVANVAVSLARQGMRVLAVDWDLEAPGLHRYFADSKQERHSEGGLLECLTDNINDVTSSSTWRKYIATVTVERGTTLSALMAGRFDAGYESRVLKFNWSEFFQRRSGGTALEALRKQWINDFDVTLIDSRTGISDSGGICTVQMPDILVPVFTANRQSLDGAKQIALRAQKARQSLAYDRSHLLIFPLPSRFDSRTEFRESQHWLKVFAEELADFYGDWVPKAVTPLQVLERTKLPYVAYFSFGEKLPVVLEGTTDPESLGFAYETVATLIAKDFKQAESILSPSSPRSRLSINKEGRPLNSSEWISRIDQALAAIGFEGKPSFGLSAVPDRSVDLPQMVETRDNEITRLIEKPPTLRPHGFDLDVGEMIPILTSKGRMRRVVRPGYKLLEVWRDGCVLFVADGAAFLCRVLQEQPKPPLSVNTLVLTESTLLFCRLAQEIYSKSIPRARSAQYLLEFRNLDVGKVKPVLRPEEVDRILHYPGGNEAEAGGERFTITADPTEDPVITAFQLVSEVYVWFGIEQDRIPYTITRDGQRRIDSDKIRSLKG